MFFSNVIFDMDDTEEMHEILSQSRIDQSAAENMEGAMMVLYRDDMAFEMVWIEEGNYLDTVKVRYKNNPISYKDYALNIYKTMIESEDGLHQLGGQPPENFRIPQTITPTPGIYLGYLNCQEEQSLRWSKLGHAHFVCPIHSDFDIIYLDYSNHLEPIYMFPEKLRKLTTAYDEIKPNDEIILNEIKVTTTKLSIDLIHEDLVLGNIGSPAWVQHKRIPKCPKSGRFMRFLAALETNMAVDFWGDGVLFIFYEPVTRVMAYYIQIT